MKCIGAFLNAIICKMHLRDNNVISYWQSPREAESQMQVHNHLVTVQVQVGECYCTDYEAGQRKTIWLLIHRILRMYDSCRYLVLPCAGGY